MIAAREVLQDWAFDHKALEALPAEFRLLQRHGDLGNKLDPPHASYELVFSKRPSRFLVFENRVVNQGSIRIWRNPAAPVDGACLIFGDSFGENFAESLVSVFSEVVYSYRPAAPCEELISLVRPSHVILEITQRFLHGSPDVRYPIFHTAAAKINALSDDRRAAAIAHLESQADGPFRALVEAHLRYLSSQQFDTVR